MNQICNFGHIRHNSLSEPLSAHHYTYKFVSILLHLFPLDSFRVRISAMRSNRNRNFLESETFDLEARCRSFDQSKTSSRDHLHHIFDHLELILSGVWWIMLVHSFIDPFCFTCRKLTTHLYKVTLSLLFVFREVRLGGYHK